MAMIVGRTRIASGRPSGIGIGRRQPLHQADHVVADIAEQPGRHRRQILGDLDARFRDEAAQGRQRLSLRLERAVRSASALRLISALALRRAR
jgi:hypothetical protein